MSRFESGAALAAVPSASGPYEAAIARVAGCDAVAKALRALVASPAACLAIDVADVRGAVLSNAARPSGKDGAGRYDVGVSDDPAAVMASAAIALRRAQHDAYGVRREILTLSGGDLAAARILLDADSAAFLVHVAAEAAAKGMTALARHVETSNVHAGVVDAYRRGARKGGGRTGAAMAFAAAAGDEGFIERRVAHAEAGDGSLARGIATRLAELSPAGGPYPAKVFRQALDRLVDEVSDRVENAAATGMRAAA